MNELADRIKYEGESTTLDFKMTFYHLKLKVDLISDVLAMANANTRDDRFIVFGVKHIPNGTKTFHLLEDFPDSAEIEQLLLENIEPTLHIQFCPFEFEGHSLAYLRIYGCDSQPYLMKKDYGRLAKGTGLIRKGTTTLPLLREDFDRIYEAKGKSVDIKKFIEIVWDIESDSKEIKVPRPRGAQFPSATEAEQIQGWINKLEQAELERNNPSLREASAAQVKGGVPRSPLEANLFSALGPLSSMLGDLRFETVLDPYRRMDLGELKKKMSSVGRDFKEDDEYYRFTELGVTLNLKINNTGPQFLDDAVVILTIPTSSGLMVSDELPRKPMRSRSPYELYTPDIHGITSRVAYPSVKKNLETITVKASLQHIKNGISTRAFGWPLRVALPERGTPDAIPVNLKLVARGLQTPFEDVLYIRPV